ncbi:MAG: hypothetical protein N2376_10505 [Clostridia bacterium]|nr:hypothetical protein [Clostridia bacterium]
MRDSYKSLKPEGSLKPEESLKQEESLKSHEPLETNKIEDASEVKPTPEAKDMTVEEKVAYYMEKLKDKSFTGTYGDGQTWYTAAEELGMIGKPAIPKLIERLDTQDDYERALVLYALLLATQHDNVKTFTQGEYINVNLDFNAENHAEMVKAAKEWWEKYKSNF